MPATVHGPLHAEVMGTDDAPPMVFLHPNPMDSASWTFQVAHLSTWYRTIAVDLPGYGRSPTASADVTMQDIADACWQAVDRRGQGPAVLVGCSVGSALVQHMYHRRPDQTAALVLTGAGYDPVKAFVPKRIEEYRRLGLDHRRTHTLHGFSSDFRETSLARWFADLFTERNDTADLDTIIAMFTALGVPDPDWLQSGIAKPVLILTGSEDNTHARAFHLHERLPDSELITLEGAGHACYIEQPWRWDRELLDFLDRRGLR